MPEGKRVALLGARTPDGDVVIGAATRLGTKSRWHVSADVGLDFDGAKLKGADWQVKILGVW